MDTISRESNSSYLPVAGVLVGVVALILGIAALAKVSSLSKKVPDDLQDRLTSAESDARNAASAADKASKDIVRVANDTNVAFEKFGPAVGALQDSVKKLEESAKAHAAVKQAKAAEGTGTKKGEAAGPGEYVVKGGDTGGKIAKELGITLHDLEAANPGVEWNKLKVGQTLKTK